MPTYKLTIEYEGTRYSGWQVQQNTSKTVQGQLRRAAEEAFGESDVGGAGRTDSGVHASGQVAHLRMRRKARPDELIYALNDRLPHDIHILDAAQVQDNFHARHDATTRIYLYQISRRRSAFAKPFVWWIKDDLDTDAMQECVQLVVGMHDFAGFSDKRMVTESTKVLMEFTEFGLAGDLILVRLAASHFLWKMVRKLIAAFVEVGRGNMTVAQFRRYLDEQQGFQPTAPPSGLFLESVLYEGEEFDRALEPIVPVFTYTPAEAKRWDAKKTRSSR